MRIRWLLLAVLLRAPFVATRAEEAPAVDPAQAEVLRVEQARITAVTTGNVAVLEGMMTADCSYVHSTGRLETRQAFLAAFADGARRYNVFRWLQPPTVRFYNTKTAVLTAPAHLEVVLKTGGTVGLDVLYTAVYVAAEAQWKLASYQSTATGK